MVETALGRHVLQGVRIVPEVRPPLEEIRDIVVLACKHEWVEAELVRLEDGLIASAEIRGFTFPESAPAS